MDATVKEVLYNRMSSLSISALGYATGKIVATIDSIKDGNTTFRQEFTLKAIAAEDSGDKERMITLCMEIFEHYHAMVNPEQFAEVAAIALTDGWEYGIKSKNQLKDGV